MNFSARLTRLPSVVKQNPGNESPSHRQTMAFSLSTEVGRERPTLAPTQAAPSKAKACGTGPKLHTRLRPGIEQGRGTDQGEAEGLGPRRLQSIDEIKRGLWDFTAGPAVKTPCSQYREPGFHP